MLIPKELFELVEQRAAENHHRATLRAPKDYVQPSHVGRGRLYVLRGRVRCAICGRRMEGSHQKGANWYRCQYVYKRGIAAADAAGHPRVLGVKEADILEPLFEFLGRRVFGPERLELLRHELAEVAAAGGDEHAAEAAALARNLDANQQAVDRQALRLEEHDDPAHPVVAAAKRRIEELARERAVLEEAVLRLEQRRPNELRPDEVTAMLAAVPDLRDALRRSNPVELAELFDAFDVTVTYDKTSRSLELAAVVATGGPPPETQRPPKGRSQDSDIAGARLGRISPTAWSTGSARFGTCERPCRRRVTFWLAA